MALMAQNYALKDYWMFQAVCNAVITFSVTFRAASIMFLQLEGGRNPKQAGIHISGRSINIYFRSCFVSK